MSDMLSNVLIWLVLMPYRLAWLAMRPDRVLIVAAQLLAVLLVIAVFVAPFAWVASRPEPPRREGPEPYHHVFIFPVAGV